MNSVNSLSNLNPEGLLALLPTLKIDPDRNKANLNYITLFDGTKPIFFNDICNTIALIEDSQTIQKIKNCIIEIFKKDDKGNFSEEELKSFNEFISKLPIKRIKNQEGQLKERESEEFESEEIESKEFESQVSFSNGEEIEIENKENLINKYYSLIINCNSQLKNNEVDEALKSLITLMKNGDHITLEKFAELCGMWSSEKRLEGNKKIQMLLIATLTESLLLDTNVEKLRQCFSNIDGRFLPINNNHSIIGTPFNEAVLKNCISIIEYSSEVLKRTLHHPWLDKEKTVIDQYYFYMKQLDDLKDEFCNGKCTLDDIHAFQQENAALHKIGSSLFEESSCIKLYLKSLKSILPNYEPPLEVNKCEIRQPWIHPKKLEFIIENLKKAVAIANKPEYQQEENIFFSAIDAMRSKIDQKLKLTTQQNLLTIAANKEAIKQIQEELKKIKTKYTVFIELTRRISDHYKSAVIKIPEHLINDKIFIDIIKNNNYFIERVNSLERPLDKVLL